MERLRPVVAQHRERLKYHFVAIAEPVEVLGREVAIDPSPDAIAFGLNANRLGDLDPAVGHDQDIAVKFEDALFGQQARRQDQ